MKELVLKDWLWQKIAKEHHAPRMWRGHVDCIFAETEKAYKVVMGATNYTVYTWIPKSQCEFVEAEHQGKATKICANYEEALEHIDYVRSCYC